MKYTVSIEIALPREQMVALFDNVENLPKWMRGLISFEPISGTPGQAGAKSRLVYKTGSSTMEMIETITVRELPDRFDGEYTTKGVWNAVRNRFIATGPQTTRWESDVEFRLSGFMMRLMAFFMPGMFRKQSFAFMQNFKAFAEQGRDVRETA